MSERPGFGRSPAEFAPRYNPSWMAGGDHLYGALFAELPVPLLVTGRDRRVLAANAAARRMLPALDGVCCDLLCGEQCLTRAALSAADGPPGRTVRLGTRDWRVRAFAVPGHEAAALYLLPAGAAVAPAADPPVLEIRALGPLELRLDGEPLGGEWLHHRPGQVLKYLLAARGRAVSTDELIEALWPPGSRAAVGGVRQAVLTLRDQLQPARPRHAGTGFVRSHKGGYALDMESIRLDADEFEHLAGAGLAAHESGRRVQAEPLLARAAELYRGDFLLEDRFAEWALDERDRLRSLAARALRTLAENELRDGALDAAGERLERLTAMDPLDLDAQRDLLAVMLRRGRRGEAARRYEVVRNRHRRAFGEDLSFGLAELLPRPG
jgi:DNA-binding SARP family transcriptional activator